MPPSSHWLDKGCVFEGEAALARLPTFTRAVRKTRPPRSPAGLDRLKPHEKLRWELDHFVQPAYQYQDCHCVRDASSSLRQPSANEREVLMGFRRDYTLAAVASSRYSSDKVNAEYERKALMGNSFSAQVVAWLLAHVLLQFELITRLPTPDELATGIPLELASPPVEGEVEPVECTGDEQDRPPGLILARRIVGLAGHRGSDVRISQDSTAAPESWPRAEVPAPWWKWKTGFSFPFKHSEHINALEVREKVPQVQSGAFARLFRGHRSPHAPPL
jgi:hypothetical protein